MDVGSSNKVKMIFILAGIYGKKIHGLKETVVELWFTVRRHCVWSFAPKQVEIMVIVLQGQ